MNTMAWLVKLTRYMSYFVCTHWSEFDCYGCNIVCCNTLESIPTWTGQHIRMVVRSKYKLLPFQLNRISEFPQCKTAHWTTLEQNNYHWLPHTLQETSEQLNINLCNRAAWCVKLVMCRSWVRPPAKTRVVSLSKKPYCFELFGYRDGLEHDSQSN